MQRMPVLVTGAADTVDRWASPRVGIKEDATQLVGSTPMVSACSCSELGWDEIFLLSYMMFWRMEASV